MQGRALLDKRGVLHLTDPDIIHEVLLWKVERCRAWSAGNVGVPQSTLGVLISPPRKHAVIQIVPRQQLLADLRDRSNLAALGMQRRRGKR